MIIGLWPFLFWSVGIVIIIFIEGIFLSKYLENRWLIKRVVQIVAASNLITLILGLINMLNFIWTNISNLLISKFQIDQDHQSLFRNGVILIVTFVISLLIESIVNTFFLMPFYKRKKVLLGTLFANLITYSLIALIFVIFK
jgi:hypothetical protein